MHKPATTGVPDDLISLTDAGTMAERSARTIRRWIKQGHLSRWDGPTPADGGSPIALVSRSELMDYLISSGQQAAPTQQAPSSSQVDITHDTAGHTPAGHPARQVAKLEVELSELRGELAKAKVEQELATARGERDQLRGERDQLVQQLKLLLDSHRDVVSQRDDWRERHDAVRAELNAVRALLQDRQDARPWWRRWLPGPSEPPELPAHAYEVVPEGK